MNCEDLKKFKEELATLSKEEQIERNKYLVNDNDCEVHDDEFNEI